jgi:hypothetical protein
MIARRKRHDAALPLFGRELQQAVGRAPQLKCPAGLQTLAFEPDARPVDLALDERRVLDEITDPSGRLSDITTRDLSGFC